jgi:hypothetical protein
VFLSGNMQKVTPVTEFEGTHYQIGPVTRGRAKCTGTGRIRRPEPLLRQKR